MAAGVKLFIVLAGRVNGGRSTGWTVSWTREAILWHRLLYRLPPWPCSVPTSLTWTANNEGLSPAYSPSFCSLAFTHTSALCVCVRGRRHDVLQSEPSDHRSLSDAVVFAVYVAKYQPVIGPVSYLLPPPPFPPSPPLFPLSPLPSTTTLGARAVPRPERFIGQLSEERLLPRGLLARAWLVDSFSISGVLFDMSFMSFKELGVSAERLGSFCKRWMARVQRSGCFLSSPSISLFPPPSFLQLFLLSLSLSFIGWY